MPDIKGTYHDPREKAMMRRSDWKCASLPFCQAIGMKSAKRRQWADAATGRMTVKNDD
ncbi:hypothetical protein [Rhizobium sp. R634]|uniref:hypothetical protein n=1 Tax=Rhizobium sp. R634 TaxID=1764274 RepID=UPI00167D9DDE|nr:hypothetical protein [Rhizobium sp. R634]